jgi:uncharacterized protein (DUF305 family)
MRRSMREFLIPVVLCVAPAAWAQSQHHHGTAGDRRPSAPTARDASFAAQMAQAMHRMHTAMAAAPRTGQPDRDFLAAMIPHHQGAIDMAKAVLLVTKDPRIRNLAQSIITEQQYEIELMRTLLAEPAPTPSSPEEKP